MLLEQRQSEPQPVTIPDDQARLLQIPEVMLAPERGGFDLPSRVQHQRGEPRQVAPHLLPDRPPLATKNRARQACQEFRRGDPDIAAVRQPAGQRVDQQRTRQELPGFVLSDSPEGRVAHDETEQVQSTLKRP